MPPQITEKRKWLYSLINFGVVLTVQAFSAYVLFFYVDVRHLDASLAATIMVLYGVWNAVNNPLLGYLSDRTHSRWGRRIPFVRFLALPLVLFFLLIWLAPFDGRVHPTPLLIYFACIIFLWEALYTGVATGYYALLPEMFVSYTERTAVSARMNLIQTLALMVGIALPPVLYSTLGWPAMGALFATLAAVALLVGAHSLFERPGYAEETPLPLGQALKATLINRAFVTLILAQTLRFTALNTITLGMAFYAKYSLKASESVTSLLFGVVFVAAMPALFGWQKLAQRLQPRTTLLTAFGVSALAALGLTFATTVPLAALVAALFGIGLAGMLFMGDVILCDVMDDDEVRTGRRREGMYYGMAEFIKTFSASLAAIIFGVVTSAYGYNSTLDVQPESVVLGFRILMGIPASLALVLGGIALGFYPLHGERLQRIRSTMQQKHG